MSKSNQTLKASAWMISGKLLGRLFDFVLLLYLSRMLLPADFGLVALAMAPIYIGEAVLELPLVQTLLRFRAPKKSMYDTAFTLSVMRSLAMAVIFIGLSFPLAQFYGDPRLNPLVCVLALAPIFRGSFSPRMVTFMKEMDFKREFFLEVFGKFMAFIAAFIIVTIYPTYWAIAAATVMAPFVMNVLSYILAPYRPHLSLKNWPDFADMIGWSTATQIISAINWQMDRLFLGHYISTKNLGQYSLANELVSLPYRAFVSPLANPLMAGFTLKKTPEELVETYLLSTGVLLICIAPLFLTLSLLAEPIVLLLLGKQWVEAIPIVAWLSAFSILALPMATLPALALTLDRTSYSTLRMSIEFSVKLVAMAIGTYYYGLWGAIAAYGLANAVALFASLFIVKALIGLNLSRQVGVIFRAMVALLIMSAALIWLRPEGTDHISVSTIIDLIITLFVAMIVYILSIYLMERIHKNPQSPEGAIISVIRSRLR